MSEAARAYRYVGPAELVGVGRGWSDVVIVESVDQLVDWLVDRPGDEVAEPFTFVVDIEARLRLAPRRSEHVDCAAGQDVLAAGEMTFARDGPGWAVTEVSNQSTGYCPDPDSWPAVAVALDRAGLAHPGDFTVKVIFRRCPVCGQLNIVRDHDFVCAVCDSDLPERWNIATP